MTRVRGLVLAVLGVLAMLGAAALASAQRDQFLTRTAPSAAATTVGQHPAGLLPTELSYPQARDLGLLRDDAVSVSGPAEVSTGGRWASVKVVVTLPARPPDRRVEVDWSGSCALPSAAATAVVDIPVGTLKISSTVSVALPTGATSCYLRADALFPGKPYTGAGANISVRR